MASLKLVLNALFAVLSLTVAINSKTMTVSESVLMGTLAFSVVLLSLESKERE